MKAILISIKPQHLANILNDKKTIEVRKNKALASAIEKLIQEYGYATIYVYCSKGKQLLFHITDDLNVFSSNGEIQNYLNGKVVCSFKCYKVEEIFYNLADGWGYGSSYEYCSESMCEEELLGALCLSYDELDNYLLGNKGYAIHISDLKIFDKPKELKEFYGYCDNYTKNVNIFENTNDRYIAQYFNNSKCLKCKHYDGDNGCSKIEEPLTKAPQNMVYVEISNDN